MEECIFCKIVNKEIPATIIYEDDNVIAFNDIQPVAPIHVLIVPKKHITNLTEINDKNAEIVMHIHLAANKVADNLGILDRGYRLITNCGVEGGQTVFHLHYHLIGGEKLSGNII